MADKSTSPFARLDKALLRSTKQSSPPSQQDMEQDTAKAPKPDTMIPRHRDTTVSTMPPRNEDTTVAHAKDDILDVVRKAVRQIGKEAATHRFTLSEKNSLADIEYTYRRRGIRTSENEITRIAAFFSDQTSTSCLKSSKTDQTRENVSMALHTRRERN